MWIFAQQAAPNPFSSIIMFGVLIVLMLLFYIPDSKRRKKLKKQIAALKQGDTIVTSGGIVGTIDFIDEETLRIKSNESKLEIAKQAVVNVISK